MKKASSSSNTNTFSDLALSPKQARAAIEHGILTNRPIFMSGPPGVGKSQLVAQIGKDIGAPVIDVRLSLWDPTDIKGLPYFDSNQKAMVWAPPVELPTQEWAADYDHFILFLDELNSAPPAVQAAAYQLVLDRRVGNYVFPDNGIIIAAGNRASDKGVTHRMPAPLANRFIHLEIEVSHDDWEEWAIDSDVHPEVISYLKVAKQDLFDFDPRSSSMSFATPRSWEYVSDLLNRVKDHNVSNATLTSLITGCIGEGIALKFAAHRKHAASLPDTMEVLLGKIKELPNRVEISGMYNMIVSLCQALRNVEKSIKDRSKDNDGGHRYTQDESFIMKNNFLMFMMNNFETELVVMGVKMAVTQYGVSLSSNKITARKVFSERYGDLIRESHRA